MVGIGVADEQLGMEARKFDMMRSVSEYNHRI